MRRHSLSSLKWYSLRVVDGRVVVRLKKWHPLFWLEIYRFFREDEPVFASLWFTIRLAFAVLRGCK